MKEDCFEYVQMFKALSDETRIKIIGMLSCEELCACKILEAFDISQPALSYHMKILTECGLVTGVRKGAWMRYSINCEKMQMLIGFLSDIIACKNESAVKEEQYSCS